MPQLSEWLKVMLSEIARKRDDAERAHEEEALRSSEETRTGEVGKKDDTSPSQRSAT
jgi:hypothetical protein